MQRFVAIPGQSFMLNDEGIQWQTLPLRGYFVSDDFPDVNPLQTTGNT